MKAQKGLMEELASLHGRELAHQCQQQGTFPHTGHQYICRKAQRIFFEITQLQPISCLSSCVPSGMFDSNTNKITSQMAKTPVYGCTSQMHLAACINFLAIPASFLSVTSSHLAFKHLDHS